MIENDLKGKRAQEKLDALAKDYKSVFTGGTGEKILEDLKRFCGYDDSSVCEQSPNELQTFFAEGKRRVYLRILWFLNREVK